jgi:hypothetical protein
MKLEVIDKNGNVRQYHPGDRLEDGESLRVPQQFMDAAPSFGFSTKFSDGSTDHTSPHRPGYRFADVDNPARLEATKAYEEKRARVQDQWRKPPARSDAAPPPPSDARAIADRAWEDKRQRISNAYKNGG